jgi:hypothetical protein
VAESRRHLSSRDQPARSLGGLSLAVTVAALLVAIYLAFQIIGLLFKLLFLVAAILVARAAWRAWRSPA